jgi:hypothetical protein
MSYGRRSRGRGKRKGCKEGTSPQNAVTLNGERPAMPLSGGGSVEAQRDLGDTLDAVVSERTAEPR